MSKGRGTFPCPVCHEDVPEGAVSCKACGADEETGWAKDDPVTTTQDLGLEQSLDDDRYDEFVEEEFGDGKIETEGPSPYAFWFTVAGIAALAMLLAWLTMPRTK